MEYDKRIIILRIKDKIFGCLAYEDIICHCGGHIISEYDNIIDIENIYKCKLIRSICIKCGKRIRLDIDNMIVEIARHIIMENNEKIKNKIRYKKNVTNVKNYEIIIKFDICNRCKRKISITKDMRHHIIPRKYNGSDYDYNRIRLCNLCHDYVEIKTEDWITSGKHYDTYILRSMIINDGFE